MKKKFREVFVFVTGTSPQVITETIYALIHSKSPIIPDEIYVITTAQGKKAIEKFLWRKGILESFIQEFNLPRFELKKENILIPKNKQGQEIEDICTQEDNEAIADLITSLIRDRSKDSHVRLHCSIAGGRKTMSFYLGSALQLFGRPWDKLYHVIVPPEFESHPEFFYKPKKDRLLKIITKDGQKLTINTSQAKITLADLPFIRLGGKLNFKGKCFRELVAEGQREIDLAAIQPELQVNLAERLIIFGDKSFHLSPSLLYVLAVFLKQKTDHCHHPNKAYCLDCRDCFGELLEIFSGEKLVQYSKLYGKIVGNHPWKIRTFLEKWPTGLPIELCRQYISKLNRELKENIADETLHGFLKISSIRIYASSRYGIKLEKSKITIN